MLTDISELLTPPVITGLIGVVLLVPPTVWALWRQHRYWRLAERDAHAAAHARDALQAALETAPEGYFAWFHSSTPDGGEGVLQSFQETGVCSRRLAVLLDLFRGLEASFAEITEGFDADSRARLTDAIDNLRHAGTGFSIDLTHSGTGRRIQARGMRAVDSLGRVMADVVWMSDVTEGVAAMDTLTEESAALTRECNLLRAALNGIAEPVWLRDDDLSLIYCNAAYVKAVDAKSAGDVVARGREIAPRVAVREARALAAAARAAAETRRAPFHMVIDGSRRLMEVTESPVEAALPKNSEGDTTKPLFSDGSGRLTAGVAYDITRQEELETRLKREAAAHADVLERLTNAIAIFGPDTRLVFFNTAFAKLWRLEPSWLLDAPAYGSLLDTLRGERKLPEVADFPAYKEKELARFNSLIEPLEDVLHLPDGGTLRRVIAPHPMGGLLTTYEDVTDKLALERSYNTLIAVQRETIDNLQEAVAVFGSDGQLRLANPAFAALWELSLEALREGPAMSAVIDAFRDFFDDATIWSRHRAVMLAALAGDRERTSQQGRVVRSDGSVLEFISVPLPDGGILFCYNDVSAPERVAQALRGRAEALSVTDKLRTEFITNVASELEGPVSAIAALAARLDGKAATTKTAAAPAGAMRDILGSAAALKTLIEDIRDLSGVEAGQQTLHLDSFDIRSVVDRVVSMTREAVKRRGVILTVHCPPEVGWMVGDAARIKQTLYHIVSGALKNVTGTQIALAVERNGNDEVTFTERHAVSEIASPGLGIYLAQRMVELHGGTLDMHGEDMDSVITCRLPAGGVRANTVAAGR